MPIWINISVVLLMCLVVVWCARSLSKSIDRSMEASDDDERDDDAG